MKGQELKDWAGYQTNRRMVIEKLLEHIDTQEKDIEHRDMLYRRKDAVCTGLENDILKANHLYADLQYVCDDQDRQIVALKAALVDRHLNMVEWIWHANCQGLIGRDKR